MGNISVEHSGTSFTPDDIEFLSTNGIALPHAESTGEQPRQYSQHVGEISLKKESVFDPRTISDPSMGLTESRTNTRDQGKSDSHMDDANPDN
jgi:hypothetical protein